MTTGGRPGLNLRFDAADPENLARLKAVLERARVGVRLVLAGPPADIHAAAAAAAACGLLEEEVTLLAKNPGRASSSAHIAARQRNPSGSRLGGGLPGMRHHAGFSGHFSRRIGGYLGFAAHAEEAA